IISSPPPTTWPAASRATSNPPSCMPSTGAARTRPGRCSPAPCAARSAASRRSRAASSPPWKTVRGAWNAQAGPPPGAPRQPDTPAKSAYRQKIEEQQALHVIDADAPQAFILQLGFQIQAGGDPPELTLEAQVGHALAHFIGQQQRPALGITPAGKHPGGDRDIARSEEHTAELQSRENLVCRLLR